jgi:hypothetical protein
MHAWQHGEVTDRDVLLLLALPASGKSEIRRYLDHLGEEALGELGIVAPTDLDDYPYVHLMRRTSQELRALGADPVFFADDETPMLEPRDWGMLVHLLNEDFDSLHDPPPHEPGHAGFWLLHRFDRARSRAGARAPFAGMEIETRRRLAEALDGGAAALAAALRNKRDPRGTIIIEFARGGSEGADMPLPFGYEYSLRCLDPEILRRAAVLYVWVTPEESRRRNRERAKPDGDASILFHGVPEIVMRHDYGTDDMAWLLEIADRPGTIRVDHPAGTFRLPAARFDNRRDLTSFLRGDRTEWPDEARHLLHAELRRTLSSLLR